MYTSGQQIIIKSSIANLENGYYSIKSHKLLKRCSCYAIWFNEDIRHLAGKVVIIHSVEYWKNTPLIQIRIQGRYGIIGCYLSTGWVQPLSIIKEL